MTQHSTTLDRPGEEQINAVLQHLARYRLSLFPALKRLPVFANCRPRQLKTLLRYCRQQQLIGKTRLHSRAWYWHLDKPGAEICALPAGRAGPMSEIAKIRALAMMRFCCLSGRSRHLFAGDELAQNFPMLTGLDKIRGYYFEASPNERLGLLRIDAVRRGRWDRVLQTVRQDVETHILRQGFRQIVGAGRFEISVVTVLPQKAKRIQEALPRIPGTDCVPVHVVAMPELLPLIQPGR